MPQETVRDIIRQYALYSPNSEAEDKAYLDQAIASLHKLMLDAVGEERVDILTCSVEKIMNNKGYNDAKAEIRKKINLLFEK
jgi:hypothetical protein